METRNQNADKQDCLRDDMMKKTQTVMARVRNVTMARFNRIRFESLSSLSVESKLLLVVSFVVTVVLATFGVVDYEHEKKTLQVLHQLLMHPGPAVFGSAAEEHQQHLAVIQAALAQTRSIHLLHWAMTVAVLVVVLHFAVSRIVIRPTQQIMMGLKVMERGPWDPSLPVCSGDELGTLARRLNEVGKAVSRRVNQWLGAERLSAMALVSNSVSRELEHVSKAIHESARTLRTPASNGPVDYPKVADGLEAQALRLETLETTLDEKFLHALEGVRAGQRGEECE
jgi:methyl-accepting chemotaxis protein